MWLGKFEFHQQAALFRIWAKCEFTFGIFLFMHPTSSRNRQGENIQHLHILASQNQAQKFEFHQQAAILRI